MIKVDIKIQTSGWTNIEAITDIISICDSIRLKRDDINLNIELESDNVSSLQLNVFSGTSIDRLADDLMDDSDDNE